MPQTYENIIASLNEELERTRLENKKLHRDVYILNRDLAGAHDKARINLSKRIRTALKERIKQKISRYPKLFNLLKTLYTSKTILHPSPWQSIIEQDEARSIHAKKRRLVFIAPLPPAKSGIADYAQALLEELRAHYDILVVCENEEVLRQPFLHSYTTQLAREYLHVGVVGEPHLYHYGNSLYHLWMQPLLERFPGIVVLHDVFLGGYAHACHKHKGVTGFVQQLFDEEGYSAVQTYMQTDMHHILSTYALNKNIVALCDGIIVHSSYALSLLEQKTPCIKVPFPKAIPHNQVTSKEAKKRLGIEPDTFLVCTFGFIGPSKCVLKLIQAWQKSTLSKNPTCRLTCVGSLPQTPYGKSIEDVLVPGRVEVTGYCDPDTYQNYLAAADLVVQLRQSSRGESSAALFDALSHGKALIINANGSFDEVEDSSAYKIPDDFTQENVCEALETLYHEPDKRATLSMAAQEEVKTKHTPSHVALSYHQAITTFFEQGNYAPYRHALLDKEMPFSKKEELRKPHRPKRLFVDVSDVAHHDLRTGIQRVVRAILKAMMEDKSLEHRVEPVRLVGGVYLHAHTFTCKFLGLPFSPLPDEPAQMEKDDIFLGLDLYVGHIGSNEHLFKAMQEKGVKIWFVLYDLLPMTFPHFFPKSASVQFRQWLHVVATYAQGVSAISNSVAQTFQEWCAHNGYNRTLHVSHFTLGDDIDNSQPTAGITPQETAQLANIQREPYALMVGTLEPRKGHAQTLKAFEYLWEKEIPHFLVIVGKKGWMVDAIEEAIRNHPLLHTKLFWLEYASDELLKHLYKGATCLIAASQGEGFGLPLIEAAKAGVPIIARDIPVFKEVAKEGAWYFENTLDPIFLANSITKWLHLYAQNKHPKPFIDPKNTWQTSKKELLNAILGTLKI